MLHVCNIPTPNVCIVCRKRQGFFSADQPEIREVQWQEPMGAGAIDPDDVAVLRGWLCSDCEVVHWAQPVKP